MDNESKNQLFRLAAVLYADNNYDVVPITIHKKIIESVLLECGSKEYSVDQIIDFVQSKYSITFVEENIKDIISDKKNDGFHTNIHNGELFVCLTEKRKQLLQSKIDNKTIDYFIGEFQKEFSTLTSKVDSTEIIYKFLYELFSTNTQSFQKLIDNKKDLSGLINLESSNYNPKEKEIINQFLQWDNTYKNKAIFDISSYALEYCMLTNKNGSSSIHLANLKNKLFYLDTNIIYRSLGINGENRKNRSSTFLKKFNDSGEKLVISKSTDYEFKEGIKGHAERIRKYDSPRVNSALFQEVQIQKDIYNFYHNWRIGKSNTSLDLFTAEIYSLYDNFKKEFKIEIDLKIPFDLDDKETRETIKDYTSSITTSKSKDGNDIIGSATIDAENILWIEKKRENKIQNIFDTKYFFVSTDQGLRRWDYQRNSHTPIVLLPSQWMSIILRYLECSSDDYKSFVNFLNLKNNEVLISSEKLHIVLSGISEMTSHIEQQRTILQNLIELKFNGVITKNANSDQIFENAKKYAKSELEKQVEALKLQNNDLHLKHETLASDFDAQKKSISDEIQLIKNETNGLDIKLSEKETENIRLKSKLIEKEEKDELKTWQRPAKWLLALDLLIIFLISLIFWNQDWSYNYPYQLIKWIDTCKSNTEVQILIAIAITLLSAIWKITTFVWERLVISEKKKEKIIQIKSKLIEKYK